jgi:uncharacterized protein YkwD
MLCLYNQAREQRGLHPLLANVRLERLALTKARRIEHCHEFSHTPCGMGFPSGWKRWAENLSYGFSGAKATFRAWMRSPEHRRNILDPKLRYFGSACVQGFFPFLWTVDLGA